MISWIAIRNFLSLRDVDVKLGKLNVLIGPNAAGKSNFVKALMLLRNTALVGYPVLDEKAGEIPFTDIVYNHDHHNTMSICAEIPGEAGTVTYEVELSIDGFRERILLDGRELYYHERGSGGIHYITSSGILKQTWISPTRSIYFSIRYPYPPGGTEKKSVLLYESILKSPPSDAVPPIHAISAVLRKNRGLQA